MSLVRAFEGGEQVRGESERRSRRPKGTREEAIRERAVCLLVGRLDGKPASYLAKVFNLTARHVNAEVAGLPESVRTRIERMHREGDPGLRLLAGPR